MSGVPRPHYGFGGWSRTARVLSQATGHPVSRQWVYITWQRRAVNGFPDLVTVRAPGGKDIEALLLEDVLQWYVDHREPRY